MPFGRNEQSMTSVPSCVQRSTIGLVTRLLSIASIDIATILICVTQIEAKVDPTLVADRKYDAQVGERLLLLGMKRFSNLTRAEIILLRFLDVDNVARGPGYAICGPSSIEDDPSNDPAQADK